MICNTAKSGAAGIDGDGTPLGSKTDRGDSFDPLSRKIKWLYRMFSATIASQQTECKSYRRHDRPITT